MQTSKEPSSSILYNLKLIKRWSINTHIKGITVIEPHWNKSMNDPFKVLKRNKWFHFRPPRHHRTELERRDLLGSVRARAIESARRQFTQFTQVNGLCVMCKTLNFFFRIIAHRLSETNVIISEKTFYTPFILNCRHTEMT